MNNWKEAEPRYHQQRVPYADAAVPICLFLVAVRLRSFVGLFRAELQVDRCEAIPMMPRFAAPTFLMGMSVASTFLAATFPAVQSEIGTAQLLGSKSLRHISDIVPAYLHSPQRQQSLSGRRDMLRVSS